MRRLEQSTTPEDRTLNVGSPHFVVVGRNRSALYAARWLAQFGATLAGAASLSEARLKESNALAIIVAGDALIPELHAQDVDGIPVVRLWDYEVGRPGVGEFACAVSGVSTVIGAADGPPGVMPAHIPEKWAGMYGASLALSLQFAVSAGTSALPRTIDVSAADVLRAFAEQNSGNHAGVPYGWRRNGRTAVEHGGVFPQGFFACKDGYMAVQARSRQDWQGILAALGNPDWSSEKEFQDPFKLSEDDSRILPLLNAELMKHDRSQLLDRALATGGPMAPVLTLEEARNSNLFRVGFMNESGELNSPFTVRRTTQKGDSK
ncbi:MULTISPECIES: CoA transferase [Paraburkholderia]|jgi:crotonobetainyl-CoA:carnitine CoA-transferase CaiB-like acyl-CoA transferase|uniref:CoA transferase n=1 Tax=Paraburkholderia madseniana TaxID=2599607 RepID=A0AAP5BK02_9BURK|nr:MULTISPECIES: CoA transferase [Paraburkholderia]MCX4149977.1 CoA transferase [Paraburkholderia madseniana]MDN7152913.1 CoA transferase [Paraburkholderia sp. WS6]MDQ6411795.1 CoA transferase [Paraburkholderia madseniana]